MATTNEFSTVTALHTRIATLEVELKHVQTDLSTSNTANQFLLESITKLFGQERPDGVPNDSQHVPGTSPALLAFAQKCHQFETRLSNTQKRYAQLKSEYRTLERSNQSCQGQHDSNIDRQAVAEAVYQHLNAFPTASAETSFSYPTTDTDGNDNLLMSLQAPIASADTSYTSPITDDDDNLLMSLEDSGDKSDCSSLLSLSSAEETDDKLLPVKKPVDSLCVLLPAPVRLFVKNTAERSTEEKQAGSMSASAAKVPASSDTSFTAAASDGNVPSSKLTAPTITNPTEDSLSNGPTNSIMKSKWADKTYSSVNNPAKRTASDVRISPTPQRQLEIPSHPTSHPILTPQSPRVQIPPYHQFNRHTSYRRAPYDPRGYAGYVDRDAEVAQPAPERCRIVGYDDIDYEDSAPKVVQPEVMEPATLGSAPTTLEIDQSTTGVAVTTSLHNEYTKSTAATTPKPLNHNLLTDVVSSSATTPAKSINIQHPTSNSTPTINASAEEQPHRLEHQQTTIIEETLTNLHLHPSSTSHNTHSPPTGHIQTHSAGKTNTTHPKDSAPNASEQGNDRIHANTNTAEDANEARDEHIRKRVRAVEGVLRLHVKSGPPAGKIVNSERDASSMLGLSGSNSGMRGTSGSGSNSGSANSEGESNAYNQGGSATTTTTADTHANTHTNSPNDIISSSINSSNSSNSSLAGFIVRDSDLESDNDINRYTSSTHIGMRGNGHHGEEGSEEGEILEY